MTEYSVQSLDIYFRDYDSSRDIAALVYDHYRRYIEDDMQLFCDELGLPHFKRLYQWAINATNDPVFVADGGFTFFTVGGRSCGFRPLPEKSNVKL